MIEIGVQLLRVLAFSGLFIAVALTYTGGLQGTGDTKSPLYISIVSQIVVPLSICFVIQRTGTLMPIHIWFAILIGHMTRCGLSVLAVQSGEVAQHRGAHRGTNCLASPRCGGRARQRLCSSRTPRSPSSARSFRSPTISGLSSPPR